MKVNKGQLCARTSFQNPKAADAFTSHRNVVSSRSSDRDIVIVYGRRGVRNRCLQVDLVRAHLNNKAEDLASCGVDKYRAVVSGVDRGIRKKPGPAQVILALDSKVIAVEPFMIECGINWRGEFGVARSVKYVEKHRKFAT